MDGSALAERPYVSAEGREERSLEWEDRAGVTLLVEACYQLQPGEVFQLLKLGADPNHEASFCGGVSPATAVLLGVADAFDVGKSQVALMPFALRSIEIWAMLGARGGSCLFPPDILVGRSVMRVLQEAASRSNSTFLLVSLVRTEERMHPTIL